MVAHGIVGAGRVQGLRRAAYRVRERGTRRVLGAGHRPQGRRGAQALGQGLHLDHARHGQRRDRHQRLHAHRPDRHPSAPRRSRGDLDPRHLRLDDAGPRHPHPQPRLVRLAGRAPQGRPRAATRVAQPRAAGLAGRGLDQLHRAGLARRPAADARHAGHRTRHRRHQPVVPLSRAPRSARLAQGAPQGPGRRRHLGVHRLLRLRRGADLPGARAASGTLGDPARGRPLDHHPSAPCGLAAARGGASARA